MLFSTLCRFKDIQGPKNQSYSYSPCKPFNEGSCLGAAVSMVSWLTCPFALINMPFCMRTPAASRPTSWPSEHQKAKHTQARRCARTHARTHTRAHTHIPKHAYARVRAHTHTHTYTHTHYTRSHACTYMYMHTHVHARAHTHTDTHTQTHRQTHTHTDTHTDRQTDRQTHTHTHTPCMHLLIYWSIRPTVHLSTRWTGADS